MPAAEESEGRRGNCCPRFLITCGFTSLFLWLALRTTHPTLSIEQFDVAALSAASNRTISFELKLKNRNNDKGVYYDALALTFSYAPNRTAALPVANGTFPPFYQGHGNSATHTLAIQGEGTPGWLPAAAARNGSAVFRVDLETAVRYKVVLWRKKRKRVNVGADLPVNGQGKLVRGKKGVKLTSGAPKAPPCYLALGIWVVVSVFLHSLVDQINNWRITALILTSILFIAALVWFFGIFLKSSDRFYEESEQGEAIEIEKATNTPLLDER